MLICAAVNFWAVPFGLIRFAPPVRSMIEPKIVANLVGHHLGDHVQAILKRKQCVARKRRDAVVAQVGDAVRGVFAGEGEARARR